MSTAATTNDFKKLLLGSLQKELDSSNTNYYVGLSRSENNLNIGTTTSSTLREQLEVRHELQSIKAISNSSFVVPTKDWVGATVYNAWDDNNLTLESFYVQNEDREVFVCVETPKNGVGEPLTSNVQPTSTLAGSSSRTFATSDLYKWRWLYKISNADYSNYKSTDYMPVKVVTAIAPSIPEESIQKGLQNQSVSGEIIGIAIDSAGYGYTIAPSLSIEGDGVNASFQAVVSAGKIVSVRVDSDNGGSYTHGTGYNFATVTPSYGTAAFRPIIAPRDGLSADPRQTLFADSLMMQIDFQNNETDTILAENEFRSVALLSGLKKYGSDSATSINTGNTLNNFTVSGASGTFTDDEIISNQSGTASARVFTHDLAGNTVYYFQTDSTGFGSFANNQSIVGASVNATIDAINNPNVDRYSGDILYINNVDAISRASNQTEDIRIVIKLD